jgi:hypothetical protein
LPALWASLFIFFWGAGPTLAGNAKNCPPPRLASVDIAIAGPILVPVTLGGQPAWMMLQTDAALTLLHQDAISSLQLPTHALGKDAMEITLGGRRVTQAASFKSMQLGSLSFSRTEFLVDPFPHPSPVYQGRLVAGSLAMDLLWPFDIELDLAKRKLALYSPDGALGYDRCYGRFPLVLGRSALQNLHLYFATREKIIYFTVADVQ